MDTTTGSSSRPGLKTIEDATEIRRKILLAFEAAERESDPAKEEAWLTFVIVGAGATGVELAGALSEIANDTLKHDFRGIDPSRAHILLVEASDRVLPPYPPDLSQSAAEALGRLKVVIKTGCTVTAVKEDSVDLKTASGTETIPSRTVLWAAGVKASRLGKVVAEATGAALDRSGRVCVNPDLTLPGHLEIFVIGDLANCAHQTGRPLPGVAQVAL